MTFTGYEAADSTATFTIGAIHRGTAVTGTGTSMSWTVTYKTDPCELGLLGSGLGLSPVDQT